MLANVGQLSIVLGQNGQGRLERNYKNNILSDGINSRFAKRWSVSKKFGNRELLANKKNKGSTRNC